MRKSDIGEEVREIYQNRPYPTPGRVSLAKSRQQLPPFAWIRAMCAMPHFSPKRILVAGCGTGAEAFALQKQFHDAEVVGIDFSSRSILQAKAEIGKAESRNRAARQMFLPPTGGTQGVTV